MRRITVSTLLLWATITSTAGAPAFHESNAVLVNITEGDLNMILRDTFRTRYASGVEGTREDPSRGIERLHYRASFSEPVLTLGEDGRARLALNIQGELTIDRFERRLLRRNMACENAGVTVEQDNPVDLTLSMRFTIADHDLRIVPEAVTLANTAAFRLHKPERCIKNPLPEFLMWWIGKPRLRRKIEQLDEVLLARAQEGADELNEDEGLVTKHWSLGDNDENVYLYPQTVDTSHGSLAIGFAGSSPGRRSSAAAMPEWVGTFADRSFFGLSEAFLNQTLRTAFHRLNGEPRQPSGNVRKIFHSSAAQALIPGLRDLESRDGLRIGFTIHAAPEIDFDSLADGRAVIRLELSEVEMSIWNDAGEERRWVGSVDIEKVRITVAPYYNLLGGISFDTLENEWRLSSRGIEFDEEILTATFQEIFFGEMFETRYDPIARDSFELGTTHFDPRYFEQVGDHLVIGFAGR